MQTQEQESSPRPKTAYEVLTEAQDLIRDPKRWTKGHWARDEHGDPVGPRSHLASSWSADGAVLKVGGARLFVNGSFREDLVDICKGEPGIVHTNDDKGHAAAMSLFDRLREKAKSLEVAA